MTDKLHLRISKCIADYSLNLEAATVCVILRTVYGMTNMLAMWMIRTSLQINNFKIPSIMFNTQSFNWIVHGNS